MIPVLKPGKSPNIIESYRPISQLSLIGKLIEEVIKTRL